jgi:N-acetylglucosaminyldiphosphoundecaprenol N-acetyl-beta-D-mannosaminyltransferase
MGVRIHAISNAELLQGISYAIKVKNKIVISNVNVHAMNLAFENLRFREFLNSSDIVFCDGYGVKFGAKIHGIEIPYRYTPPDWIQSLCELCVKDDYSLYFLGAKEGVADQAAEKLIEKNPNLKILGTHHGYFSKYSGDPENEAVIAEINSLNPDIIILGLGMPLQEYWLMDNWVRVNSLIAIPAGAIFDYISENVYRFPNLVTENGFEWLARLIVEPKRLWRRYLIGNPLFIWRVYKYKYGLGPTYKCY